MNENEIIFNDTTKSVYTLHPIVPAKNVDYIGKNLQLNNYGRETFVDCPGMFDYRNSGWIMPAWEEITIYSSEQNSMLYYGDHKNKAKDRGCPFIAAGNMDKSIAHGFEGREVALQPLHITSPWSVQSENVSLLVLPPVYHSNITQFITVFPGIVDYTNKFTSLNCIISPHRHGTFTIKAGTPLLHLIPFVKQDYDASYRAVTEFELDRSRSIFSRTKQFYRKHCMKRSKYSIKMMGE